MANGMLSQEEINALLSGSMDADVPDTNDFSLQKNDIYLTAMEKDTLGEIANISMGTAATTLSQLVGRRVEITTPTVDETTAKGIFEDYPVPHILVNVQYKKGIEGSNMLVLSREDGSVIVDLMMGGTGKVQSDGLTEMQISGISEAMNQMMGSAATSMSTMFKSVVDITPPEVIVTEFDEEISQINKKLNSDEPLIRVSFRLIIEGIIDSILLQVLPMSVAKGMASKLIGQTAGTLSPPDSYHQLRQQAPPAPPELSWEPPKDTYMAPMPGSNQASNFLNKTHSTFVEPAQFSQLSPGGAQTLPSNLGLIFDVPLQVNVELGKATKTIKDILELGPGSVVELDRLAGEPVDMFVNGKLIAKCEVVVINETFGIRITEIVNPNERIDTLN